MERANDDKTEENASISVPFLCRTISLSYTGGDLTAENTIKEEKPYTIVDSHSASTCNKNQSTTACGADTSNGFHNTIAVLERHVKQRKLWSTTDPNAEEDPTGLELQLMAIERLKSLSETTRLAWFLMNYIIFTDINNASKREQKQENIEKLARNLKSDTNDCLYHIAREKSGLLYLKIVKSPQKERGK